MVAIRAVRHETSPDKQLHPPAAPSSSTFRFDQNLELMFIKVYVALLH
jgi:hypothetical protein